MSISLHDMTERIGDNPTLESLLAMHNEYADFAAALDEWGRKILMDVDASDLTTASDIIRSVAIADALGDGTLNMSQLSFLMSDRFLAIFAVIFKLSVGLAAMEEWR